jgi:integrase
MIRHQSVKSLEALKPKTKDYKVTVDRGLYLKVATTGSKVWLVRYVIHNKQKQIRLPEPFGSSGNGYMSLAQARALNAEIQALAKDNVDYVAKKAALVEKNSTELEKQKEALLTFSDLFNTWITEGLNRQENNKAVIQLFNKHALPFLADIPIRNLSESDLQKTYRRIIDSKKTRTAVALSNDVSQMLRWAEKRKPWRTLMVDGNPADLVELAKFLPVDYEEQRDRVLSSNEIVELHKKLEALKKNYSAAKKKYSVERPFKFESEIALWICLSTLCRIGELLMTEWKHLDFDKKTWLIPKENVKGTRGKKQDQLVFLSDFSLSKFRDLYKQTGHSKWAFPAKHNKWHVCVKSISKQVGDRQSTFKNRSKNISGRVNTNSLVLGDRDWTPHDLRRTGATMMQQLGIPHEIIDRCQNHIIAGSKVRRHYLHYDYAAEKKDAWAKLGESISSILKEGA